MGAALEAGADLEVLFREPDGEPALVDQARGAGVPVLDVEPGGLEKALSTRTPQPVAAIAPWCDVDPPTFWRQLRTGSVGNRLQLALVLVGVGDPGNAGTLIRSAAASGAAGVVFTGGSVDPFNPKCVRASAGALFAIDVVRGADPVECVAGMADAGIRPVATHPSDGTPYHEADLTGPLALLLGGEAAGLPPDALDEADELVTVPIVGPAESLNVAMAGTVLLFEAARQRAARSVEE